MGRASAILQSFVALSGAFMALSTSVLAYTPTIAPNGSSVRWRGPVKFNVAGNPQNLNGISAESFYSAVVRSLQRWSVASENNVRFDYWQGTDRGIYEPDSEYNGLSSVYFSSNAKSDPHLSPNVLGLTQVWYNTDTGEILESDTVLNDRDFRFTTNPKDTSGYGSSATSFSAGRTNVYIENVLTHELGHALGLSHSGGLQSTMLFMESPEQAHLGCDELTAIRAVYPGADSGRSASLNGAVVTEAGAPVFGAHVLALSRRRGTVLATGLTDKQGHYTISALEPGSYFLVAEPFFAGAQALPSFYSGVNPNICHDGSAFSRTALSDGVLLTPVHLAAGNAATAPKITARCTSLGGAAIAGTSASSTSDTAPMIYNGASEASGFGAVDRFLGSSINYYKLKSLTGHLELHVLDYSIYSPVHSKIELMDSAGNPVEAKIVDHVYSSESGYINFDSALVAEGLAGDYTLKISGASLASTLYPAGITLLDSVPFLVITGSVNEGAPPLASITPVNAHCRMDENFAAYTSPPGNPPRASLKGKEDGVGFCGTISSGGSGQDGGGTPFSAILGWMLPWVAMAGIARAARRYSRMPVAASCGRILLAQR